MSGGKPARGLIHETHEETRKVLRVLGPALLTLGVVAVAVGFYYFSGAADTKDLGDAGWFEESKSNGIRGFVIVTAGMFSLFVGGVITKFAFMGAVARYTASEIAPVGADTINYVGEEARPGLTAIGTSIGAGLATGRGGRAVVVRCHKCQAENATDARFCQGCGVTLAKSRSCPSCGELNDHDARFCDDCGVGLT